MDKKISDLERKRRKYRRMYNSFKNKLIGENLIWWNSLERNAQYSVLFNWINEKKIYSRCAKLKSKRKPKLKYFLSIKRISYIPTKTKLRESKLDNLLNEN